MNDPAEQATLAELRREFPGYRIWLEPTHSHLRFIARRQGAGTGLHTVITADPAELRSVLAAAQARQPAPPALPRRRPA